MKDCYYCGRKTFRTKDWACQWCGYPLISGNYKKVPKTYQQLKEERQHTAVLIVESEPKPQSELKTIHEIKLDWEEIAESVLVPCETNMS